jgi:hypothetical protein
MQYLFCLSLIKALTTVFHFLFVMLSTDRVLIIHLYIQYFGRLIKPSSVCGLFQNKIVGFSFWKTNNEEVGFLKI